MAAHKFDDRLIKEHAEAALRLLEGRVDARWSSFMTDTDAGPTSKPEGKTVPPPAATIPAGAAATSDPPVTTTASAATTPAKAATEPAPPAAPARQRETPATQTPREPRNPINIEYASTADAHNLTKGIKSAAELVYGGQVDVMKYDKGKWKVVCMSFMEGTDAEGAKAQMRGLIGA